MEGNCEGRVYMICARLDEKFNNKQWEIIRKSTPEQFIRRQQTITERLLSDKALFQKYFSQFYSNHVKLLSWSMLATQKKSELSLYIFKALMNNGMAYYKNKVKQRNENRFQRTHEEHKQLNLNEINRMEQEVYKDFFDNLLVRNKIENVDKPLNLKLYGRKSNSIDSMDGHQFYIRTFNACNGWKYIFYNYQKHMKGLSEKQKYNNSIRVKQEKRMFENKTRGSLNLLDYQHEDNGNAARQCEVINMNKILMKEKNTSFRKIKNMAKMNSVKKMVFVNHQGKPTTYRISRS